MERKNIKDIKLMPRAVKMGLVCDLSLPTLEVCNFIPEIPENEDEKRDSTQEFRKSRTKIAQNRSAQKGLF